MKILAVFKTVLDSKDGTLCLQFAPKKMQQVIPFSQNSSSFLLLFKLHILSSNDYLGNILQLEKPNNIDCKTLLNTEIRINYYLE